MATTGREFLEALRDGALINARQMGSDFDKSCHGLKPVHLRSIGGLLFICLAEEAPADIDALAPTLIGAGHLLFADRTGTPPGTEAVQHMVTTVIAGVVR